MCHWLVLVVGVIVAVCCWLVWIGVRCLWWVVVWYVVVGASVVVGGVVVVCVYAVVCGGVFGIGVWLLAFVGIVLVGWLVG